MKTIAIGSIFALLALMVFAPSAFADHAKAEVSIAPGSSTPGCEATNECYIPHEVTIDVGGEVTWSNDDTAGHTVTSGTLDGGPDGNFDSSLFMAGTTFSHKFEEAGEFPYFCVVHPWMTGVVIVQEAGAEEHADEEHADEGGMMDHEDVAVAMTQDGSIMAHISAGVPTAGEELAVTVEFTDADGNPIEHVNFDILATQDGNEVMFEEGQHSHTGMAEFATAALESDSPVDFDITILGIGLPDDEANWTGPIGETISAQVVPEFGPIAMMVLAVAIVSIIAVTTRSKVIPKL
ncbi:MAG: PEFG-CTERM sorting domain-containing protein [Candidatus Nitrosotenuis sp.]